MTRQEAIDYQRRQAERSRKYLNETMEKAIKELEEYKDMETWKVVSYLECTIERLENARKMAEKDDLNLNLLTQVFKAVEG